MPTANGPSLTALSVNNNHNGGGRADGALPSPTMATTPSPPGANLATGKSEGLVVEVVASTAGGERDENTEELGLGPAARVEAKAAEIVERVLGMVAFCERVGAVKDLEVCFLYACGVSRFSDRHSVQLVGAGGEEMGGKGGKVGSMWSVQIAWYGDGNVKLPQPPPPPSDQATTFIPTQDLIND